MTVSSPEDSTPGPFGAVHIALVANAREAVGRAHADGARSLDVSYVEGVLAAYDALAAQTAMLAAIFSGDADR